MTPPPPSFLVRLKGGWAHGDDSNVTQPGRRGEKKKADEHCHNLARPCMVPRVGPDGAVAWDDVNGWLFGA